MAEHTFSFVDLAGFTAATSAHGDVRAADLAERFHELAARSVGDNDRVVKSIGDEVMCVSSTPIDALRLVSRLCRIAGGEPDFPLVRAGVHRGTAEERSGDYFGSAVNIAARVAGLAKGGELMVTDTVIDAAGELGLGSVALGAQQLRNVFESVDVFRIELTCCGAATLDPVCQMRVTLETAVASLTYGSRELAFCSTTCLREFKRDPSRFVDDEVPGASAPP